MDSDALQTYVFNRKLHPDKGRRDKQVNDISRVVIHNGYRVAELEFFLKHSMGLSDPEFWKYTPVNSEEPHFYVPSLGVLHIVNTRDPIRTIRDFQQAEALGVVSLVFYMLVF